MERNKDGTMESIGIDMQRSAAVPIFGAAERVPFITAAAAVNDKICPIIVGNVAAGTNKDNDAYENSSYLKNLSVSEILKMTEVRARVAGIGGRSTDNPWHKRMAVSDNIMRRHTTSNNLAKNRQTGPTDANDLLDNEDFFENLMKKMTTEQFMPCSKTSKMRKRTCLWNKENSSIFNTIKRHKDSRISAKSVLPTKGLFAQRLLPVTNNNISPAPAHIQSRCKATEKPQDRSIHGEKSTPDLINKDVNMKERGLSFGDCNLSAATTESLSGSCFDNQASGNCTLTSTHETLKLRHDRAKDVMHQDANSGTSPCSYYTGKYYKNPWNSPRLSTIEEYHEPSTIDETTIPDAVNMEFDVFVHLTPPLTRETDSCEACSFAEEEYDDNVNNSGHLSSPMTSDSPNLDFFGIQNGNLFLNEYIPSISSLE